MDIHPFGNSNDPIYPVRMNPIREMIGFAETKCCIWLFLLAHGFRTVCQAEIPPSPWNKLWGKSLALFWANVKNVNIANSVNPKRWSIVEPPYAVTG